MSIDLLMWQLFNCIHINSKIEIQMNIIIVWRHFGHHLFSTEEAVFALNQLIGHNLAACWLQAAIISWIGLYHWHRTLPVSFGTCITCIYSEIPDISSIRLRENPSLYPPFGWFILYVLNPTESPFIPNNAFVYRDIFKRNICIFEILHYKINERPDFVLPIIIAAAFFRLLLWVVEVEVLEKQLKPSARHDWIEVVVTKRLLLGPVTSIVE